MSKSLLTLESVTREEFLWILERSADIKARIQRGEVLDSLRHRLIGLLFEKPSTRTRTSFEAAALRLGARTIYLSSGELQLKRGEPVKDTARVLGAYLDALIARVYAHTTVEELSAYAGIPVVNALSDEDHPTQAICDLLTVLEVKGGFRGLTLAYIGDGNNVCHALLMACALAGLDMVAACPAGYTPKKAFFEAAQGMARENGTRLSVVRDPREAAAGADILYTDVWVSMGEEDRKEEKLGVFAGYQINRDLLALAGPDVVVMHCLPAYRGLEITEEVLEGPRSIVWLQGENKMYGAAGILEFLFRE